VTLFTLCRFNWLFSLRGAMSSMEAAGAGALDLGLLPLFTKTSDQIGGAKRESRSEVHSSWV
jgi:hypothetical protein